MKSSGLNNKSNIVLIILGIILLILIGVFVVVVVYANHNGNYDEQEEPITYNDTPTVSQNEDVQSPVKSAAMSAAEASINQIVSQYGQNVAVALLPLDANSQGFNINGSNQFVSASMIKLLILANYIEACDSGRINENTSYSVKSSDIVGGTGKIQNSGAGASYTYDELAHYMIKCSDNTATNILVKALGMDSINSTATKLGLQQTRLNRLMMDTSSGVENYTSANDAATILSKIANKTLGSASMCDKAIGYLSNQEDNLGLSQGLNSGVTFAHKTGSLSNYRHDGGIVYCSSPYVLVCLCNTGANSANNLMQQIAKICATNLG